MLVTFRTPAAGNIVMFGDVAVELIRLMGHSGKVPGALQPEELASAIQRLKKAVEEDSSSGLAVDRVNETENSDDAEDNDEPNISLKNRAFPLIQLLQAAEAEDVQVIWDS